MQMSWRFRVLWAQNLLEIGSFLQNGKCHWLLVYDRLESNLSYRKLLLTVNRLFYHIWVQYFVVNLQNFWNNFALGSARSENWVLFTLLHLNFKVLGWKLSVQVELLSFVISALIRQFWIRLRQTLSIFVDFLSILSTFKLLSIFLILSNS